MALKHKVSINVAGPGGGKRNVLRGAERTLPQRLLAVYVLDDENRIGGMLDEIQST